MRTRSVPSASDSRKRATASHDQFDDAGGFLAKLWGLYLDLLKDAGECLSAPFLPFQYLVQSSDTLKQRRAGRAA